MNHKKFFYRTLLLISFLFIYGACKHETVQIPRGIIASDTMINILADIHLAEAKVLISGGTSHNSIMNSAYLKTVLTKSKIDTARFSKSFNFYSTEPALFSKMYDQVISEISKRQAVKNNAKF